MLFDMETVLPTLQRALRQVNGLRAKGLIEQYAIGGAWAATYFSEPIPTEDLDVFCHLPSQSLLISLSPIYDHLRSLGYKAADGSHADSILIEDVPVQFLAGNALVDEAIDRAISIGLMGEPTRIFDLEYVIAIALDVGRPKDLSRIETLLETTIRPIQTARLEAILTDHIPAKPRAGEVSLLDRWTKLKEARDAAR
jgi:hypothetical protein